MQFSINTNPSATQASLNLSRASDMHRKSLARLSSGQRIVNPADDAGGLAVGNKLDSKLARLEKVGQNLKNTSSFLELQESALAVVGTIITRMSELKTMATDVTKNSSDVENYNKEFVELQKQIEAMTKHKFNGVSLFSDTNMFAGTDADGRAGHGLDLARNFVFDEYVAESGAVLGQSETSGGENKIEPYTIQQWRTDYDNWINYDDSDWDTQFELWKLNPEPYGGLGTLNMIKSARDGNWVSLDIMRHNMKDLTPLAGLKNLTWLSLPRKNEIQDISPLAALGNLQAFSANDNQITDITPLAGLTKLRTGVWLHNNQISDLRPLANLNLVPSFNLRNNPITESQKEYLETSLPGTSFIWPNTILQDGIIGKTTTFKNLDQFTTEDFTSFTQSVASAMAEVGSHQSRLNMEVRQNESARVNLEAAKSRIMDADMAQESSRFAKTNVLVQSSASMVAKANQLSEIALRLMVNR